jgi:hypothetical protein
MARRKYSSILDEWFRGADCYTDHYMMAKLRDTPAVSKQMLYHHSFSTLL